MAYDSLRDLGDLTIAQSPVLNQAQLMESIMHAMQLAGNQYGQESEQLPQDVAGPPRHIPPPPQQHANNAFESNLLKIFAELTAELSELKQGMHQRTTRSTQGRTPKRYCWSCGCCPHWGRDCEVKKHGHKNDENFKKRKGESDKDCRLNV